ncbi:hypothetical protein MMC11_000516 [Xylographa trunciseda]|nr:hypothetical protein [Xylographa trunciseda]
MAGESENPFDLAFTWENQWTTHVQQQQLRVKLLESRLGVKDAVSPSSGSFQFNSLVSQHEPSPPTSEVLSSPEGGARAASPTLSSKPVRTCNEIRDFASMWYVNSEMTPPNDFEISRHTPETIPHEFTLSPAQSVAALSPRIEKRGPLDSLKKKMTSKKSAQAQFVAALNTAVPYTSAISRTTDELKRSKFLERNRTAAVRCRERKKVWEDDLAKRVVELESRNYLHTVTITALNSEMSILKEEVLKHSSCGPNGVSTSSAALDETTGSTSVEQEPQTIGATPC